MTTLYYIHDPMCSWCWGFTKTWRHLQDKLPEDIKVVRLLGGLAPDNNESMPDDIRQMVQNSWQRIEQNIPGIKFNFDYWQLDDLRRTTYPSCRAVIAARQQGKQYDQAMTVAIQQAYYQQARNPANDSTLLELAEDIGLDIDVFKIALNDSATQQELLDEIEQARIMHVDSFLSLVLEHKGNFWPVAIDYNDYRPMLELIEMLINKNQDPESGSG